MSRVFVVILLCMLASCQLPPPGTEVASEPAPPETHGPAPVVSPAPVLPPEPIAFPPPPATVVTEAEPEPPAPAPGKHGQRLREPTPQQLIQDAQHAARVAPTKRGYWGGSGVQRYVYVPGKIYDVYLAPGMGTKLALPPTETLAHALILNPHSFDVSSATVGNDLTMSSIILIRPCAASEEGCVRSPDVDVAVTSTSGRGYNLHLIIGKVGMIEVTWELTPLPRLEVVEPSLIPGR